MVFTDCKSDVQGMRITNPQGQVFAFKQVSRSDKKKN